MTLAATEDWRTGVVELPADHVYGATALTAEEWAALPQRKGAEFNLIERAAHGTEITGVLFSQRVNACDAMRHYARLTPDAFDPFGPLRMVVKEAEK